MAAGERSYGTLTAEHLGLLGEIAQADLLDFLRRNPRYAPLKGMVLAVALCQGAALHFVNGTNGVKDFDVWTFFKHHPDLTFPPRRLVHRTFPDSAARQLPDKTPFDGRRIDLIGRSLKPGNASDPRSALRAYLSESRTRSARLLAQKAVVLLQPSERLGEVVWP